MKPFYFVKDVIEQLEEFNVRTVDFELYVGGDGHVGFGNSVLTFTVDIQDYKAKRSSKLNKDIESMLGGGQL